MVDEEKGKALKEAARKSLEAELLSREADGFRIMERINQLSAYARENGARIDQLRAQLQNGKPEATKATEAPKGEPKTKKRVDTSAEKA